MQTEASEQTAKPRLSCEKCTARKVKCDKRNPCSNCQRAGVSCVPVERHRLPRGRHLNRRTENPGSDSELRERLARLEALVQQQSLPQPAPPPAPTPAQRDEPARGSISNSSSSHDKSSADTPSKAYTSVPQSSFWKDIVGDSSLLQQPLSVGDLQRQTALFGPADPLPRPSSYVDSLEQSSGTCLHRRLCQVYLSNFDPVFKLLHSPSLSAWLLEGKPYLDYSPGHNSVEALEYAVYFAAVATLNEDTCAEVFGAPMEMVYHKYRLACETALCRADFIVTEDLTVLQAYVLYLVASRIKDRSRRVWTLLALALRIAQALQLHIETPHVPFLRPFEREMRRRLWYGIGVLDMQAALERGRETMIPSAWLSPSTFPLIISDDALSVHSQVEVVENPDVFTSMTYNRITCKAQSLGRVLNFPPHDGGLKPMTDWHQRHALVDDFRASVFDLLQRATRSPGDDAFYFWAWKNAEMLTNVMALVAVRPLRQQPCNSPPNVRGPNILKLAVNVIGKLGSQPGDPAVAGWMWTNRLFTQWHGLAIALSELCACEDADLVRSSWPTIEFTFERLKYLVADDHLNVWGPIEKLMASARKRVSQIDLRAATLPLPIPFTSGATSGPQPMAPSSTSPHTDPSTSSTSTLPLGSSTHLPLSLGLPTSTSSFPLPPAIDTSSGILTLPNQGQSVEWMDVWNPLDDPLDMMATASLDPENTAAWASWDAFMSDIQFSVVGEGLRGYT